ncbi:glyoxalase/bleomycin resistance/dioxygenase family protein [Mangrovimicrobium sediminis]|uniref:Glyoxalase/bleomycin resistance/dioxygenase family protein n=1 Tax=Mangrovimicrobium sediminis TaxID=2562682 RepID=A0A4Z0LUX5_9GAMM|nr:ArsI/CadI family heavy metal resistance metalloenzyme [Haliea sp. SAOS-164]TGD71080.1 glyoxalase/bleomycin resistance/dioxygenase family protein [Haliea sp. SAOS-164]
MKRMHIHVGVEQLDDGVRFYSALFGAQPVKVKDDYAKWMLDDPCINFAISTRVGAGVDHLGLQVEETTELDAVRERLKQADMALFDEGETVCCYARSEKSWVRDPAGVAWETYQTMEDVQLFGENQTADDAACCVPAPDATQSCCG